MVYREKVPDIIAIEKWGMIIKDYNFRLIGKGVLDSSRRIVLPKVKGGTYFMYYNQLGQILLTPYLLTNEGK